MNLGSAIATIDMDITGFVSKADQAASVMNGLGKGGDGLDGLQSKFDAAGAGAEGFGARLTSLANVLSENERRLTSLGKGLLGFGTMLLGAVAAPMIAGSNAAWGQVDSVEQATIALSAYEKDADKVNAVLSDLVQYAQSDLGVLFQRQDLFASAQALKLYGAETDNLSGYVEILSRSVGLGLSNWDDLNRVVGRVGSTGRLTGNDFDYLRAAGFDLDETIRNTDITWEELMAHLDAGMPADALAGQADTIRGKTIRLQSALRNLGLEFLGVDKETSKFIEGGLGDTLVKGLEQGRLALLAMGPAAAQFGQWVAAAARAASSLVDKILALPQPILTALTVMTGLTGAAAVAAGSFLIFLPRIGQAIIGFQNFAKVISSAMTVLKGVRMGVLLTNPVFLALAAAVAAFTAYQNNIWGFRDAVDSVVGAFMSWSVVQNVIGWVQDLVGILREAWDVLNLIQGTATVDMEITGDDKVIEWVTNPDAFDGTGYDYMVRVRNPDGSLGEFGQIIDSYTDENDPNIVHMTVETDDGQVEMTYNKVTGTFSDTTMTIDVEADTADARSGLERIQDALDTIADLADQKDMPLISGIARTASSAVGGIQKLANWFGRLNPVVKQIAIGFGIFLLALKPIIAVVTAVVGVFTSFMSVIGAAGAAIAFLLSPVGLVIAAVAALAAGLIYAYTHFDGFREAVNRVAGVVKDLASGALDLLVAAVEKVGDAWNALTEAFSADGWSGVWDLLVDAALDGAEAIWDAITGFFGGIDWGSIFSGLQGIGSTILGYLGDLGGTLMGWIQSAAASLDWSAIWSGAVGLASSAVGAFGDLVGAVAEWIAGAIPSLDTWKTLLNNAGDIITGLSGKLGNLAAWVVQWITDAIPSLDTWRSLLNNAGDIITGLSGKLGNLIAWVVQWITDAIPGADTWRSLLNNATDIVTGLSGKLGNLIAWVVKWITDAIPGSDTWRSLLNNATDIVTGLSGKLGNLIAWVVQWITDAVPGIDTWRKLVGKAGDIVTGLSGKLGNLGAWAIKWITDAAPSLEDWKGLIAFASDITGDIIKALGDLTGAIGDWIQGAIDWAQSKWDARPGWMGGSGGGDSNEVTADDILNIGFDGIATHINDGLVAAIDAMSGESLSVAVNNWIGRGLDKGTQDLSSRLGEGFRQGISDAVTSQIDGMSGDSVSEAISSWFARASERVQSRFTDTAMAIARGLDTALNVAMVEGMSGESLAASLGAWITKAGAVLTGGGESAAIGLNVARSIDTAVNTGLSGLSGASLSTGIGAWITRAASSIGESGAAGIGLNVARSIDTAVGDGLSGLSGASLSTAISSWIGRAATTIGSSGSEGVGDAVAQSVNTAVIAGFGGLSGESLAGSITAWLGRGFTTAFTDIQTTVSGAMSSINAAVMTGMTTIQVTVAGALSSTSSAFTTAFLTMQVTVAGAISSINAAVTAGMTRIQATVASSLSATSSTFTAEFARIQSTVTSAMASVTSTVSTGMTRVQTTVSGAMSSAVSATTSGGSRMGTSLAQGVANGVSQLRGALNQIPGIINGIAGSGAGAAYNAGAAIGAGFANGMRAYLGVIRAAAAEMVAAASAAVRARAMISSPSKLFRGYGEYVGEGFEMGIRSMVPDVANAAESLVATPNLTRMSPAWSNAPVSRGGTSVVYSIGDIVVHQRPGEDGEALANRIVAIIDRDYESVNGLGA